MPDYITGPERRRRARVDAVAGTLYPGMARDDAVR